MAILRRFVIFFAVNLLVVVAISFIVNLLGIRPYLTRNGIDYQALLVFCAIFGFGGAFISLQLSRFMAKQAMGVQLIDPERPRNSEETAIVERVRALCARAGLSTLPEIGIYPSAEVNAFATGPSKRRALLAISAGLLQRMDDRAIDGVLGHEISHIVNGDMVTMTLVQGVVNTFVIFLARVIAFAIDSALRSRDDDRRGGLGYFAYIMLVSALETGLMLLAAPILYFVSRMREYRADAGSAQLSGRETMIHALESLQDYKNMTDNRNASLSTLKINGQAHGLIAKLYASHPPLEARIKALRGLQG